MIFNEVSKFYGEVLGVNRVTLNIPPGITSLVGPNGSGKTTLMNLMTGLIHPDNGQILIRGISPRDPEALMRITGYATQYDTAPRWATGFTFITTGLLLFGYERAEAEERAWKALERLSLTEAANRKVASYSKGMRQRVRLAQAIAHDPEVLVLDEPLNGLDPLVRAETIAMFRTWANEGKHVILSSHVLQEVDLISDQVVLIANGMIIAEGTIRTVREEIQEHPSQYLVRCRDASGVASRLFSEDHITEIRLNDDRMGMLVMTRDREQLARALGLIALDGHHIDGVLPADENVDALYQVLDWRRIEWRHVSATRARQAWTIARIELRRAFLAKRGLWVYALAILPALIFFGHGLDAKWRTERLSRRGLTDPAAINSVQKGETLEVVKARLGTPAEERGGTRLIRVGKKGHNGDDDARDRPRRRCAFRSLEHQPPDLRRRAWSPRSMSSRCTARRAGESCARPSRDGRRALQSRPGPGESGQRQRRWREIR